MAELTHADLLDIRRSIRQAAREVEDMHTSELERLDARYMAPPKRLEKEAMRWGGGYRNRQASDYDWFYALSKAEQARLRENWFREGSQAPDEIAERIDLRQWLEHTRRADASRALATGRGISAKRYGELNPNHLIADAPYDVRKIWGNDADALAHVNKAQRHGGMGRTWRERMWDAEPDRSRVQYFTDAQGRVHPIRASYEHKQPAYAPFQPGDDEAF